MDGNTCRLVSLGYTVPATKQILNLLLGLKISWAGAGMSCFALTLTDGGRIARLFTCSSWTFSSFSIRAKNVTWVSSEQSVLWVKLNNSKRSEPAQSSVWRLMLYKRLELVYNVIIWFCNPKVSSLAPVQRCCALNRLEIEETARIWPQPPSHSRSYNTLSHAARHHRYSVIFRNHFKVE